MLPPPVLGAAALSQLDRRRGHGFDRRCGRGRRLSLARVDFLIARVHAGNTSPKQTEGECCDRCDPARVRELLGPDPLWSRAAPAPLVSCILPTGGRRSLLRVGVGSLSRAGLPVQRGNRRRRGPRSGSRISFAGSRKQPTCGCLNAAALRRSGTSPVRSRAVTSSCSGTMTIGMVQRRLSRQVDPIVAGRAGDHRAGDTLGRAVSGR